MKLKKLPKPVVIAVLLSCLVGLVFLTEYMVLKVNSESERQQVYKVNMQVATVTAKLESAIYQDVYTVDGLTTLLTVRPYADHSELAQLANEVLRKSSYTSQVAIAPNDVFEHVFPLDKEQDIVGIRLRDLSAQWPSVLLAKRTQNITLDGPIVMLNGNIGVIARFPVFTDPPFNTQYWGLVNAVMPVDRLFQDSGVYDLQKNADVALRHRSGETFLGDEDLFAVADHQANIRLPGGIWTLAVKVNANEPNNVIWIRAVSYSSIFCLVLAFLLVYRAYRRMHQMSLFDELTGLANRRFVMRYLSDSVKNRHAQRFVIINIDLDRFKQVNDRYGHAAGDALLVEVAMRLKDNLRQTDVVSRLGGDEFFVILTRQAEFSNLADKLLELKQSLSKQPMDHQGHQIPISASMGMASYPDDSEDLEALLKVADQRMYQDKNRP